MQALTDKKTEKVAELIRRLHPEMIERLLVVGCGDGVEAAILASKLGAKVTGIDTVENFDRYASTLADLRIGDAMRLEFEDESFDFVYSYHALEHITDPGLALREMHRVLRKGGGFWIGTPNRTRLVGYIGAKEGSVADRLRWNLSDYRARLAGKFRNEYGAHAGFSSGELRSMLSAVFSEVREVTQIYFLTIYASLGWVVRAIGIPPFSRIAFPSVYFMGRKKLE
jgi:ubiquinone/menaquinone biosynthesis C-methylase UbiE